MLVLEGEIINYLFSNPENGYAIARLKTNAEEVIIVGYFANIIKEFRYQFTGDYVVHAKYGRQFKVEKYEQIIDKSQEGIISYLSSGLFYGIGPITALKIYQELGEECLELIIQDKNVLNRLGFSEVKKNRLYEELINNHLIQKILIKLYEYGITSKSAMKLVNEYKEETLDVLHANPYKLIDEISNFGFKRCDDLALKLGFRIDDSIRLQAGIFFVLRQISFQHGYTFLTKEQIINEAYKYLTDNNLITYTKIEEELIKLIESKKIIKENENYYLPQIYEAERKSAQKLSLLLNNPNISYDETQIKNSLEYVEDTLGISYTFNQKKAITETLTSPVSIVTGGPGTGKTTVINGIIHAYSFLNKLDIKSNEFMDKVALVAPTGRASKRIKETTKVHAQTIHRLLGYSFDLSFTYDAENLLKYDLIIVDESSMIDIFLLKNLVDAVKNDVQLIFVGDEDQLPSVGPGQILRDLIFSKVISVIRLTEIHRQVADSKIINLASHVRTGQLNYEIFNQSDELVFINSSVAEVNNYILNIIKEAYQYGYSLLEDIQILAPMYKGENGIDNLNLLIQEHFNGFSENKYEIKYKDKIFRIKDKVIQLTNNFEKKIMNGDVGIIKDILYNEENKAYLQIDFDGQIVKYHQEELEEIMHAYAISVHKSQGSEYKIVILPVVKPFYIMLRRKLIYTAITRAKIKLIIVGDLKTLEYGVNNIDELRQTSLSIRFMEKNVIALPEEYCFKHFGEENMENITPYTFMEIDE